MGGSNTVLVRVIPLFMIPSHEKYKQKGIDTAGDETIRLELEIKPYKHARMAGRSPNRIRIGWFIVYLFAYFLKKSGKLMRALT